MPPCSRNAVSARHRIVVRASPTATRLAWSCLQRADHARAVVTTGSPVASVSNRGKLSGRRHGPRG